MGDCMSLDMALGARQAAPDYTDDDIETQTGNATPVWIADLMRVAAAAVGVMLCSLLGLLLFLR